MQRDSPQGNEEQKNRFLVYVPSPQETRHRTQYDTLQELLVRRVEPQFDEVGEDENKSEGKSCCWTNVWEDSERR